MVDAHQRRRPHPLLGAFLVVALATACAPPPADPLVAAVVRGDGFLVPFAAYEDGAWSGPSAEAGSAYAGQLVVVDHDAAWFADRRDALRRWETPVFHPARGEPRAALVVETTGDPIAIGAHCESAWALATSLEPPAAPTGAEHHAEQATFSRPVETVPIAELDASLPVPSGLMAVLTAAFDAAEQAAIDQRSGLEGYGPRRSGAAAAKSPLAITRLFRTGGRDGWSIYLFDATRTYERADSIDPDCDDASVMTGWLVESPWGGFTILSSDIVLVSDCDNKGGVLLTPLATLSLDGSTYTLVLAHYYESESYRVYQVDHEAVRMVLDVYGGGC